MSLRNLFAGYRAKADTPLPLGGYATLLAAWTVGFLAAVAGLRRRREPLPALGPRDLLLLGPATHKLARIVTKDWVTAPVRARFTEYQRSAGGGEVVERSRGRGLQRAIGDLLTCEFCIGPWIAAGLLSSLARWPQETRFAAGVFTLVTVSDFLHRRYQRASATNSAA